MIPLFTQEQLDKSKTPDKLPCKCHYCLNIFFTTKREIMYKLNNKRDTAKYCSNKCRCSDEKKRQILNCSQCNKQFEKKECDMKKSKSGRYFCSKSCNATYQNTHKTTGIRRSKLEIWLESKLTSLYPKHKTLFNDKTAIGSEIDIYFPELKIAFELNGLFHYEPIFGQDKLDKTKNNDNRKFQACIENGISLCVIDSSSFKHFKEEKAKKYLDIITNIISGKVRSEIDLHNPI